MKRVSLFVLAISTSMALWAQPDQPKLKTDMASQTRFGIRAGANLANYNAEGFATKPDVNAKTSMHAGVFVNVPLGTMFAFQPGVEYSGQGSKIKYVGTTTGFPTAGQYEEDLHYINIPMMLQWKPAGAGGFFLETGPQPGFLISATRDNTGTGGTPGTDVDIKAQRDKFDLSWGAGLGYLTRVGLGLNARYNYGLTNTIQDSNNSTNSGPELKNRTIQLGLVYHFGANK